MNIFREYGNEIKSKLEKAIKTQEENIYKAAEAMYNAQACGKKIFIMGSGHSHMLAEEVYARAGGYVNFVPILEGELMLHQHPEKSTMLERLPGYANILFSLYKISKDDVIIIISNSGRNALPVELALASREAGAKVIALTNLSHSQNISSRHSSGKRLYELADIVIDNCGDYGDAFFSVPGIENKVGASSTIIGSFIMQSLAICLIDKFSKNSKTPDIFVSSNLDGSDEKNRELMDICINKYR